MQAAVPGMFIEVLCQHKLVRSTQTFKIKFATHPL